jgi:hypothetical protein
MVSQVDHGPPPLLIIDLGAAAITAAVAFGWPLLGAGFFARVEKRFASLASHKLLAVCVVGLSVFLLRIAILPFYGIPNPFSVDDFSFLLSADTFAHGRLTNPTPAMWTHFESIHITMVPTYQSMYFPGQGLLMAASQVVLGHPWWGVMVSSAVMCAALTWALQAWIPANWALLGGFIAVLRIGVFSYWTNTYHAAGSLCALGGALILGSLPRLTRTGRMRYGLTMAIGVSILELTRPYDGMLLCLPVTAALLHWVWNGKNRPALAVLARRAALPLAVIVAASAWLGYYDLKAFGKATTLPYTLDRAEYAMAPYFLWQHPRPAPKYRHAMMREFYQFEEMGPVNHAQTGKGLVDSTVQKPVLVLMFYSGFMLLAPLLMLRRVLLDRRVRFLVVCLCVLAAGMVIEIFLLSHYVAPFLVAIYAIGLQAMRHLRLWKPEGRPVGLGLVRLTVAACVALAGLRVFAQPLHLGAPEWPTNNWNLNWFGPEHYGVQRAQVEGYLEKQPGPQLAIVRYQPEREASLGEWVYNAADIDEAKVVWAREMSAAEDLELRRYYKDRTVWLVEPDAVPVRVMPYQVPETVNDLRKQGH